MSGTKSQQIDLLLNRLVQIRESVHNSFYYLEAEELRYKPSPEKWSIVENIEHINLVNHFYLKGLSKAVNAAEAGEEQGFRRTLFGKWFARQLAPKNGLVTNKMPTFKKINPVERARQGYAVVEKVVFQNFMDDLSQVEAVLKAAREKRVNPARLRTFAPLLRLSFGDALEVLFNHTERHIIQAKHVLHTKN
jgi:hypothetical protein